MISCGAALHHLGVAAEGFGLVAEKRLLPEGNDADILARIHLEPGKSTVSGIESMAALENRTTDRRGYSDWEVPEPRLRQLAEGAIWWGAHAMPVTDPGQAAQAKALVEEARARNNATT